MPIEEPETQSRSGRKPKDTTRWYEAYPLPAGQRYTDDGCIEITIFGIRCKTPPIPPKNKIAGINLPVKEQYFRKTAIPAYMDDSRLEYDGTGNLILNDEQEAFAYRENRRICDTGYWLMIKGVITWIYGTYYFELNYWEDFKFFPRGGTKEFRKRDKELWYIWWQVKNEPLVVGIFNLKHRRAGATHSAYSEAVVTCMRKMQAVIDCFNFEHATNKLRFQQMFKPPALRCKKWIIGINNLDEKSSKYEAKSPVKRKGINNVQGSDVAGTLSTINILPTTQKGADGGQDDLIVVDEFFKWYDVDFGEFIDIQIPVVTLGAGIQKVGNIFCISSTEEIVAGNTAMSKWRESKKYRYNEYGQLTSPTQFIPIFFPASYCLHGFVDLYGDPIQDEPDEETKKWMIANPDRCPVIMGSKRYLTERKDALRGSPELEPDYYAFCRKHPESEEEAFQGAVGNNSFNKEILNTVLMFIRSKSTGVYPEKGTFEPINDHDYEKGMRWVADPRGGRFEVTMKWANPDQQANRMIRGTRGLPSPLHREGGCITVDPYSKDVVIDEKRASKGAAHGLIFFDENNERTRYQIGDKNMSINGYERNDYYPTPSLFFKYNERPDDVTTFFDDMLKACIYYGMPMSFESNTGQMLEKHFRDKGFENYMLSKAEYMDNPGGTDYLAKGLHMNESAAIAGYGLVNKFLMGRWEHLNGYFYKLNSQGEARRLPFEATVLDLMAFNFKKPTPHDLTMSLFTGMIYYDKLFKHRGSIFEQYRPAVVPDNMQGYESDILQGLAGYGTNEVEDVVAYQTRLRKEMLTPVMP